MLRIVLLALILLKCVWFASAQDAPSLRGRVEGMTYYAPNGSYSVAIPVLPELGASITDTSSAVVFRDEFKTHVSIGSFQQDASQRWELSTRGLRDYLAFYFLHFVVPDFEQLSPAMRIESTEYDANLMGGALIIYTILPEGTMFAHRLVNVVSGSRQEPEAKRGNLLFIRHGYVYVISMELAERVVEGSAYNLTTEQENRLLRERMERLLEGLYINRPPAGN